MLISMNWISDFVDLTGLDKMALIRQFSLSTAEVENEIFHKGADLSGVVAAQIVSVENHPESHKLHLLKVDAGDGQLTDVVCGAPNVQLGMKTAFAKVGAQLGDITISPRKLAGYTSYGMCCSEKEIGISDDNSGIMVIPEDVPCGTDLKALYPIDDIIFEVDNKSLTNRPDLWGHYGMAREFSTLSGRPLKALPVADLAAYNTLPAIDMKIEDPLCQRYSCLRVENINRHVSPMAMRIRLNYCGMRDINFLADLTNYLMLEMGQPMHAFDFSCVDGGRIVACDAPRRVCRDMRSSEIFAGFPSAARIAAGLGADTDDLPITVREGRQFLSAFPHKKAAEKEPALSSEPALTMKNVWFRYERSAPDILRGTTLEIMRGEIFSVLGGNGSGKTTLLRTVSGAERAYRGKTFIFGKNIKEMKQTELHRRNVAMLPQNVQTVFLKDSVRADLTDIYRVMGRTGQDAGQAVADIAERLGISALLDRHPYDLSGGEMQKSALAKILLTSPRLLLLDEPTKGIDAYAKENLGEILRGLRDDGITVVIVTHDVEFAASYSDRCGLFFDGELLSPSCPQKFFGGNDFYTTAACRMSRGIFDGTVTVGDVTALGREGKDEV